MRLYSLERLVRLVQDRAPSMPREQALKKARKLRRALRQMGQNWDNSERKFRDHHVLIGLGREERDDESCASLAFLAEDPTESWCDGIDQENAMRQLSPVQSTVMHWVKEGYTDLQIAKILGTSRSRIQRHRKAAQRHLRRLLTEGGPDHV